VSDTPSMIVPEPVRENELMAKYGIKFDGYLYLFGEYKYAKLDDAVRYAKIGK